jgi:YgiT-type zinc finger domain-containing protein
MEMELGKWMQSWCKAHPKATLTEIEAELDQHVAALRVRVLQETLETGVGSVEVKCEDAEVCPVCGTKMEKSGRHKRKLKTTGGQALELEREYVCCPQCGKGFFPPRP